MRIELPQVEEKIKEQKKRRHWHRFVTAAAAAVILMTTGLLIRPAMTLETEPVCGVEEHVHTEECYSLAQVIEESEPAGPVLVCGKEEHTHAESCYPQKQEEEPVAEEPVEEQPVEEEPVTEEPVTEEAAMAVTEAAEPLDPSRYVSAAKLYYRIQTESGVGDWILITSETTGIPGNADVKLAVDCTDVPIESLLASDGKMIYTLPPILRDPEVNGVLLDGNEQIGTMTAEGNQVLLALDKSWLEGQQAAGKDVVSGDFFLESKFNLAEIEEGKPGEINIGDVTIEIDFDGDIHAKYGEVYLEKTVAPKVTQDATGDYLEYTLVVSVPENSGTMPEVVVKDKFTINKAWVEAYVDMSGAPYEIDAAGNLVWNLGDMEAGSTKTLTYRVKLKEGYTGVKPKGNIENMAEVYSKGIWKDSAKALFIPSAGMDMRKRSAAYQSDGKGKGIITYTVWVKANENNSYILDNVKIHDSFENSEFATAQKLLPYLKYKEGSFHLYHGGTESQNGGDGLTEITDIPANPHEGGSNPVISATKKEFEFYLGDLEPGDRRTLTYQVEVDEAIFTLGNEVVQLKNKALELPDDRRTDAGGRYNAYQSPVDIGRKIWNRKLSGDALENSVTIEIPARDSVYSAPGVIETDKPANFQVPAGSFRYQVVANEAGDWDLSGTLMSDTLGDYMGFTGYVQVRAYEIVGVPPNPGQSNEQAVQRLETLIPDKSAWLKIDGADTFSFEPGQLGVEGRYAYLLTYYATPKSLGDNAQVVVSNDFSLDGTVIGPGGIEYQLDGITVSSPVTVQNSDHYGAGKFGWYYEWPQSGVTDGNWSKGSLYWGIEVNGNYVSSKVRLKDIPGTNHVLHSDSVVGVYKGILPEGTEITDYENLAALQEIVGDGKPLTLLGAEVYSQAVENSELIITFNQAVTLDEAQGEKIYVIVRTEPNKLITEKSDSLLCENRLMSSGDGGQTWGEHNTAQQTIYGTGSCYKEAGGAYEYDGTAWKSLAEGAQKNPANNIVVPEGLQPGTYVEWFVHINRDGKMGTKAEIADQLPEGLEPVYVRYYRMGKSYYSWTPQIVEIAEYEGDPAWKKETLTAMGAGTSYDKSLKTIYYYNAADRTLRWNVKEIKPQYENDRNEMVITFQVLCRVTDKELLQSGESQTFENRISAKGETGGTYSDQAEITFEKTTLSKKGTYDEHINGGIYPFEIRVNELGEDLMPQEGVTTVTLVDELSSTLILDITSIRVVNSKDSSEVTGWTSSIENTPSGQILRLKVPDNLPLTITYHATVNAAPGQEVSISNKAHWEGYPSPEGGNVEVPNFSYNAGGTIITDTTVSFKILKKDQADNSVNLQGAVFKVEKVPVNEDGTLRIPAEDEVILSEEQTTDENGTAVFSEDNWMEFNTLYCLTETKAPAGYVLDSKPYYFAVAKPIGKDEAGKPIYPEQLTVWNGMDDPKIFVSYGGKEYIYTAYNHKGEAIVEKKFLDKDGNEIQPGDEPDGSYQFGIYAAAQTGDEAAEPLQTMTISYQDGTVTYRRGAVEVEKPNFINLELGTTYYIYELDDNGFPIVGGDKVVTVDGKTFTVSYSPSINGVTPGIDNQTDDLLPKVTVINKERAFALPETGGEGTGQMYLLGTVLAGMAAGLLLYRRRKKGFI